MDVFKKVAEKNGVESSEVEREIELAIRESFLSDDENVQTALKELFPNGTLPTAQEFVVALAKSIIENL